MTPPVRPKMVAAPVESPNGLSKGASESAVQSTPTRRSRQPNSRTVSTASTSGAASAASSGATGASGTRPASLAPAPRVASSVLAPWVSPTVPAPWVAPSVPAPWVAPTTVESSGTSHSYFFATQGITDTTNSRLASLVGLGGERVLNHGTHHLVRRLGAGKLGRELRIVLLHEAHPAGTAAREHGARRVGAEEFHELAALFHNGEVGGEVGVEDA